MTPSTGTRTKSTTILRKLNPDPVLERPQCSKKAIEKEVAAVTTAPCRPNVVEREGRSAGCEAEATSAAEV
jgi:hypothetical protein